MDASVRPATSVILASGALAGVALGATYVVADHVVRDDLAAAFALPAVVAIIASISSLAALGTRGDRWTPLRMLLAWWLLVPTFSALTTALISLPLERAEYVPHACVQSAARAAVAVTSAALVLAYGWFRRRLKSRV